MEYNLLGKQSRLKAISSSYILIIVNMLGRQAGSWMGLIITMNAPQRDLNSQRLLILEGIYPSVC